MRKHIVAGNWKMNKNATETKALLSDVKSSLGQLNSSKRIIVAPPYTSLFVAKESAKDSLLEVAAQNMHQSNSGAFTGEISADMLIDIGVNIVILGHSERRAYFGENDEILREKVNTALANGLEIIFCFGELLEDRIANNHFHVVEQQLTNVLFHLKEDDWKKIILAYEPVWAIGTGETATPDQAQEMHQFIRKLITKQYSDSLANEVSILYGGSVKPSNAKEIFSKPDVDGGLIGGASLQAGDFMAIVDAF